MADLRRRCPTCKRQFRPRKGTRRIYCESCRPPAPVRDVEIVDIGPVRNGNHPLIAQVRSELDAAGRLETSAGMLAMVQAEQLVGGQHTASQFASLSRELRETLRTALAGVKGAPDALDELTARRRRKLTG